MKTYIIDYSLYDKDNNCIKRGTVRVKNKITELQAKVSADTNLKRLYKDAIRTEITRCREENPFKDIFGDLFKF